MKNPGFTVNVSPGLFLWKNLKLPNTVRQSARSPTPNKHEEPPYVKHLAHRRKTVAADIRKRHPEECRSFERAKEPLIKSQHTL